MSGESLRDRLASLSRREIAGLVAIALVGVGAAGLWYVRSLPRPIEVRAELAEAAVSPGPPASPGSVFVHVAGWVRRPGVYELEGGDRVIDALEAAGGPRRGADLTLLNLAAPLVDGQQVLVVKRGAQGGTGGAVPGAPVKVNVNTAGAAELEALPGIGPVLAQKIIDHRAEHGPFRSVDDLLAVSGIGDVTLAEIRDLVTV